MLRFLLVISCLSAVSLTGVCGAANLVALFEMEDNVLDSTGQHTATLVGDVSFAPGKFGKAASFDGTGDHIEVAYQTDLSWSAPKTITAWILSMPNPKAFATIASVGGTTSWRLQRYGSSVYFDLQTTGTAPLGVHEGQTCPFYVGTWEHIAVVDDGTQKIVYVDGVFNTSLPYSGTCDVVTSAMYIGASETTGREWKGLIDDLAIFDAVLTVDQVNSIMRYGAKEYKRAYSPVPAAGSRVDPPSVSLSWSVVDPNTYNCDVFFSQNSDMSGATQLVSHAKTTTASTAVFGSLADETNYYWRVDTYDPNDDLTLGEVWRLRTTVPRATSPNPDLGATLANVYNDRLSWIPGRGTEQQRLYISKLESEVTARTAALVTIPDPNNNYNPFGPRDFDETYYWAIDAVSNGGATVTPGMTWNFNTPSTSIINNMNYSSLEALQAVWIGTPTPAGFTAGGWLICNYGAQTNTYYRTFWSYDGGVLDLSDAGYIRIRYTNGSVECPGPFPVVKFRLRNSSGTILLESTRSDGEAGGTTYDWIVPVKGLGLNNVHKMEFEVGPYAECASGLYVDYIVAVAAGTCEATLTSSADMNNDCLVNILDLAAIAGDWLSCTWVPETMCP